MFTQDFIYDAEKDHYTYPAGQHLTRGRVRLDRRFRRRPLSTSDRIFHLSSQAPLYTGDKLKGVKRWKHEGVLDAMQARLDRTPDAMSIPG